MNIATSNLARAPEPTRADLPATVAATGVDADGGDPSVASGADLQDFGQILSDSLAKGRAPLAPGQEPAGKALIAAGVERVAGETSQPTDKHAATDRLAVQEAALPATKDDATDPTIVAKAGESSARPVDAVSTDLSSQLALAAQWAGLPPPVAPTIASANGSANATAAASAPASTSTPTRGIDLRAATDQASVVRTVPIDIAQVQGAALPAAFEAAAFALDRNTRANGSSTTALDPVTKPDTTKPGESASLAATDGSTAAIDRLFAMTGAGSSMPADPSSLTSQFVAQITAQVSNAQNASAAVPTAPAAALGEPVGSAAWSHELGQTAIRMATNDVQNASMHLNPEHLGPLDIQMRIDNGVAHLQFNAAHAETRHALESSRTTLDQMFSEQGLKLGDWSVGNSSSNGSSARNAAAGSSQGDGTGGSGAASGDDAAADDTVVTTVSTRPLGLVDTFA